MAYVWLFIVIIIIGMFAEAPWLMTGILLLVIGVFLFFALRDVKVDNSASATSDVDKGFTREAIRFFEGYLTLCSKYQVQGHAFLDTIGTNEFGYNCNIGCHIVGFEGKKAVEGLNWIEISYNEMLATFRADGYEAWKLKRDGFEEYMKETYIGMGEDLHYCFSDPDEWKFHDETHDVTLGFERQFFLSFGKWDSTLVTIKNELKGKFPDADIQVYSKGIVIK